MGDGFGLKKGKAGDAIVTAISRNDVHSAETIDFNDGANLAVDRDGLTDNWLLSIHGMGWVTGWID